MERQLLGRARSLPGLGLATAAALLVATVAHTWPLARQPSAHMQSGADPKTMMAAQYDLARNLATQPLRLFDGSAFHPYDHTLAVVDHQIGNAVLVAVPAALGASPVLLFNLVFLATFVLSGLFTWLLVRRLTGSGVAGIVAGFAFAFATARIYNLPHSHALATQWLPLTLWALDRFLSRPTAARWLVLAPAAVLLAVSSWHLAVIGGAGVGVVTLWMWLSGDAGRRQLFGLIAVAALVLAVLLPIAVTYAEVGARWPPGRDGAVPLENIVRSSVDLGSGLLALPKESRAPYAGILRDNRPSLNPGFVVLLLGLIGVLGHRQASGVRWRGTSVASRAAVVAGGAIVACAIGAAWLGLESVLPWLRLVSPMLWLGAALTALGVQRALRQRGQARGERAVGAYLAMLLVGVFLALGPRVLWHGIDLGSGVLRLDLVPLPMPMRAPVRFGLLVGLGAAVLSGYGVSWMLARRRGARGAMLVVAVLAALNVDLAFEMPQMAPVPAATGVDQWLAHEAEPGAVFEVPVNENYWALFNSQYLYDLPNVDGRGFLRPPAVRRLRAVPDLSERQLATLWEDLHPRYIVVRGDLVPTDRRDELERAIREAGGALTLLHADGADRVYELSDRGQGTIIERRWPRSALAAAAGFLSLEGRVVGGRPGTDGYLQVWLNDRLLREVPETVLALRGEQNVDFEPADLVDGDNRFVFRAAYRYLPESDPVTVGATGGAVRADIEVYAGSRRLRVEVNGLPAIDVPDEAVVAAVQLEQDGQAASRLLRARGSGEAQWSAGPPPAGAVVALALRWPDDGDERLGQEVLALAAMVGVRLDDPRNVALAAIGCVGAPPGAAVVRVVEAGEARVAVGEPARRRLALRSLQLR